MATLESFSGGMFFKMTRSLIPTIPILFTPNFDHIFKIRKKLEKFQYCFYWENFFYKIYKTYNHEFSIKFSWNIYLYDFYYDWQMKCFQIFPSYFFTILTLTKRLHSGLILYREFWLHLIHQENKFYHSQN